MIVQEVKSVLKVPEHDRLLQNAVQVCRTAGVPVAMLHQNMKQSGCSDFECKWIKSFPTHAAQGIGGLCMVGVPDAIQHMMAMAASLLRNYIDARVMVVESVLAAIKEDEGWSPSALFIPNFCVSVGMKSQPLKDWQSQQLYGVILDRYTQGKQTVLYVGGKEQNEQNALLELYGDVFADLIKNHWTVYKG